MNDKLRVVQVGIGSWGWSWIGVVLDSPNWELVGIVDLNKEALQTAARHYKLDQSLLYTSLKEACNASNAHAALIVVPPEVHAKVIKEAAELGLHCLVEKPIADNIRDAIEIIRAAERNSVKLMVSQNYRFKRAPETVRQLVKTGIIGEIGTVYINFQKAPHFTGFRTQMKHPLITDMSIHHFDQIRGVLGLEAKRVHAHSWNPYWSWFHGDASATVIFEMNNGARVVYNGSWVSRGWETTWDGDWYIQGSEGEIHWANNEVVIRPTNIFTSVFVRGARETGGHMVADLVPLVAEDRWASLHEFHSAIVEDREPVTSGRDNLRTLAMVLAARRSSDIEAPVTVDELLSDELKEDL